MTLERDYPTDPILGSRVLVVDDHDIVAQSIVLMLRAEGVAAERVSGPTRENIVDFAAQFAPDVVLLDFDLGPLGFSLDLVGPLHALPSSVILFTADTDRLHHAAAIEAGASGVAEKTQPAPELLDMLRRTLRGGTAIDESERQDLLAELRAARDRRRRDLKPFLELTPRESDVLLALIGGHCAAEIAEAQYVSVFTVRGHIRSILTKLGVNSQLAAVTRARDAHWEPIGQS